MSARPIEHRDGEAAKNGKRAEAASNRTALYIVLAVAAVVVHELQWVLLPFVISGLVAYICTPLVDWLAARSKTPRFVAATACFLALLIVTGIFAAFAVPSLVRELVHFATDLQGTLQRLAQAAIGAHTITLFGQSMNAEQLARAAATGIRRWIAQTGRIATLGSMAFAAVFGAILLLVLLFYFLISGPSLTRGVLWLFPSGERPFVRTVWRQLDPLLKRYFIGVILILVYATAAAYIGLGLVLGIKHAVFLALLTGMLEIIPVIGPGASAVIGGLAAVHYAKGIGLIIGYAIYAVALRISIDQILGPVALGTAARLHPVVIIFCFLAGGVLFGLPGIILAVPVALTVRTALSVLRGEADGLS
ncbi:MAG: AI-2E family transporter [Methylovirgula sp.]